MPNNNQAKSTDATSSTLNHIKTIASGLFSKLRGFLRGMRFWKMALLCFGFRCFVMYPLGPILALFVGTLWCVENLDTVRRFFQAIRGKLHGDTKDTITSSLWYENGGREQIDALVLQLSDQGEHFCNLAEKINLPSQSHWLAIETALNGQGIQTQVSYDAFYIAWELLGEQE